MTRRLTTDASGRPTGRETIRLDQEDWMKILAAVLGLSITFFGALVTAGWTVSTAIHEADMNSERRVTKIETIVVEHDRRIGGVEARLEGRKP